MSSVYTPACFYPQNGYAPERATNDSAGYDLIALEKHTLWPWCRRLIRTGVVVDLMDIPERSLAFITPRSGLANKHGLTVLNSPGLVDQDYPGEFNVILINLSWRRYVVEPGDRIAQAVFMPYLRVDLNPQKVRHPKVELARLWQNRGVKVSRKGGFGSTGLRSLKPREESSGEDPS